jgi:hypothetical protein
MSEKGFLQGFVYTLSFDLTQLETQFISLEKIFYLEYFVYLEIRI